MARIATKILVSAEVTPCKQYKFGIILNVIGLIILTLIVVAIFILVYVTKCHHKEIHSVDHNLHMERQSVLRIVTRNEWVAQPPNNPLDTLTLPVDRIIIAETQTEGCTNRGKCIYLVRMIQMYHIESRHFDDIAYNFLVGGDGSIYEGRGWNKQGAHTKGYNSGSIGIALIGEFSKHTPPIRQFDELKLLLAEGVRLEKISTEYTLYAQRAFAPTESPGEQVMKEIQSWSHFVNKSFREM